MSDVARLSRVGVEQLTSNLYRLLLGRYQAFLWTDPDGATLVDTGAADAGVDIATALEEIGLAPHDIKRVVLTHFHDDHMGAAAEVREWGEVVVIAPRAEAPIIRGEQPGRPPDVDDEIRPLHDELVAELPPAPPVEIDREVDDGDVIDFGGGARVIAVPGHTDGSIALHLPEHRVLFTGDAVAEHLGRVLPPLLNLDHAKAAHSMRRLAELDAEVALFGHGEPALFGAAARLRQAVDAL
jgi:glyoxylase-like metal-dependent hydrolase (beta-lactamase superfamily II)